MFNHSIRNRPARHLLFIATAAIALHLGVTGCRQAVVDDASLTQAVQSKLSADAALASEPIQASVQQGVATLNGSVSNEAARSLASSDAAQIAGIKTVVNNLTVAVATGTSLSSPGTPGLRPEGSKASSPVPTRPRRPEPPAQKAFVAKTPQVQPAPIERPQGEAPSPDKSPQPLPVPASHSVTLPAGSTVPVRLNQTLDSASTQTGESFSGSLASDILVDGVVVLPQGTPVSGRVDAVQEAAHFKGNSLLTIELTSIDRKDDRLPITTESFSKEGNGRGKNSAEKIGGGAAVGAILGGIFGGGKGAAIGAAAGGGAGAGVQGVTKGQQVQIPAESLVRFHLADAVTVRVNASQQGSSTQAGDLQRH